MNFGQAIELIKAGYSVRRAGWNGKGMLVHMKKGSIAIDDSHTAMVESVPIGLFEKSDEESTIRLPTMCFRTAQGSTLEGWLASQSDMFAEDWQIVEVGEEDGWRYHVPWEERGGLLADYDDGTAVLFSSASGGAAPEGSWGKISLLRYDADGNAQFRDFTADSDWYDELYQ